ncbi:MAG: hypothetical protein LBE22_10565, partial [Azoarcus sp.]|nr:hypothetical protein [Azoarcus sp.]
DVDKDGARPEHRENIGLREIPDQNFGTKMEKSPILDADAVMRDFLEQKLVSDNSLLAIKNRFTADDGSPDIFDAGCVHRWWW